MSSFQHLLAAVLLAATTLIAALPLVVLLVRLYRNQSENAHKATVKAALVSTSPSQDDIENPASRRRFFAERLRPFLLWPAEGFRMDMITIVAALMLSLVVCAAIVLNSSSNLNEGRNICDANRSQGHIWTVLVAMPLIVLPYYLRSNMLLRLVYVAQAPDNFGNMQQQNQQQHSDRDLEENINSNHENEQKNAILTESVANCNIRLINAWYTQILHPLEKSDIENTRMDPEKFATFLKSGSASFWRRLFVILCLHLVAAALVQVFIFSVPIAYGFLHIQQQEQSAEQTLQPSNSSTISPAVVDASMTTVTDCSWIIAHWIVELLLTLIYVSLALMTLYLLSRFSSSRLNQLYGMLSAGSISLLQAQVIDIRVAMIALIIAAPAHILVTAPWFVKSVLIGKDVVMNDDNLYLMPFYIVILWILILLISKLTLVLRSQYAVDSSIESMRLTPAQNARKSLLDADEAGENAAGETLPMEILPAIDAVGSKKMKKSKPAKEKKSNITRSLSTSSSKSSLTESMKSSPRRSRDSLSFSSMFSSSHHSSSSALPGAPSPSSPSSDLSSPESALPPLPPLPHLPPFAPLILPQLQIPAAAAATTTTLLDAMPQRSPIESTSSILSSAITPPLPSTNQNRTSPSPLPTSANHSPSPTSSGKKIRKKSSAAEDLASDIMVGVPIRPWSSLVSNQTPVMMEEEEEVEQHINYDHDHRHRHHDVDIQSYHANHDHAGVIDDYSEAEASDSYSTENEDQVPELRLPKITLVIDGATPNGNQGGGLTIAERRYNKKRAHSCGADHYESVQAAIQPTPQEQYLASNASHAGSSIASASSLSSLHSSFSSSTQATNSEHPLPKLLVSMHGPQESAPSSEDRRKKSISSSTSSTSNDGMVLSILPPPLPNAAAPISTISSSPSSVSSSSAHSLRTTQRVLLSDILRSGDRYLFSDFLTFEQCEHVLTFWEACEIFRTETTELQSYITDLITDNDMETAEDISVRVHNNAVVIFNEYVLPNRRSSSSFRSKAASSQSPDLSPAVMLSPPSPSGSKTIATRVPSDPRSLVSNHESNSSLSSQYSQTGQISRVSFTGGRTLSPPSSMPLVSLAQRQLLHQRILCDDIAPDLFNEAQRECMDLMRTQLLPRFLASEQGQRWMHAKQAKQ